MLFKQVQTVTVVVLLFVSAGSHAEQIAREGAPGAGNTAGSSGVAGRCVVSPQCLYVRLTPPGEPMPTIDLEEAKKMACENTFMRCDQEKIAAAYIHKTGSQRISLSTGAVFIRDTSNPQLGEAYRDPSGLVWSNVLAKANRDGARIHCDYHNARLPTDDELEQLARFLGKDTPKGYSPFQMDGKTEVLPGLSKGLVWSSTPSFLNHSFSQTLRGFDGAVTPNRAAWEEGVLCVSGR